MSLADDLRALGHRGKPAVLSQLGEVAPAILPNYGIDTPLRQAHFWAQISHECAGFKTMHEYWGPTKAQARYEGRKDLGNTQPGDGYLFRGRGLIQLTGRVNYAAMGKKLGVDLVGTPDLAADPVIALRVACEFWRSRGLNALADKNDIRAITKRINGGYNGLADRKANFVIAWRLFGDRDERPKPAATIATSREGAAAIAAGASSASAVVAEVSPMLRDGADLMSALGRPTVIVLAVVVVACLAIWIWRKQRFAQEAI